jgi:ribosomal protein S12 methylthiotransferase
MAVQAEISRSRLQEKIGRTFDFIVDEVHPKHAVARGAADAPEIDGMVRVKGAKGVKPGDIVRARVTDADEHDLKAVIPA